MDTSNLMSAFATWLDGVLSKRIPAGVRAFNFNLYEAVQTWDVELVGAESYDPADPDWACDAQFLSAELFYMPREIARADWEAGLATAIELITTYLRSGKHRETLRTAVAVGVGFVDGDLTILWPENAA